jgi:hypothetical protein
MHVREVQATGGGHFAQVARELGYVRRLEALDEASLKLAEQETAQADHFRRKRSEALVERLKRARERLGVTTASPSHDSASYRGSSR